MATDEDLVFEKLVFEKHLTIPTNGDVDLSLSTFSETGEFEFWSSGELILKGILTHEDENGFNTKPVVLSETKFTLRSDDLYQEFEHRGYVLSGPYRMIEHLRISSNGK